MRHGGDNFKELFRFDRLWDVCLKSRSQGALTILDSGVCCHGNRRNDPSAFRWKFPDSAEQLVAILFRHRDVTNKNIHMLISQQLQRGGCAVGRDYLRALCL